MSLTALNYGAVIQKLTLNNGINSPVELVAGLDSPADYLQDKISLGATVGRFAGRISGGGFSLENSRYDLFQKDGVHLHGGKEGFGKKFWDVKEGSDEEKPSLEFSYLSPHLEEGYPGELSVRITYMLENSTLHITHEATTDRPTIVNLTNHSYFRLDREAEIDHYLLRLNCDSFLETDKKLLPTGSLLTVENTEFDFRMGKRIGNVRMDTPFVCNSKALNVAELSSDRSGIRMRVSSNQPAVVVYTPLDFPAICFETQNFPDAPNYEAFPSSVLLPDETYLNRATFEFDFIN